MYSNCRDKYLKYKNKYLILKKQIGSSKLNYEEQCKAKKLSKYPFSIDLLDGKKCEYTLKRTLLKDIPIENFYKDNIVYRGLMINSRFNFTFDELIKEFTENGGMASSLAEITDSACAGNKELASNSNGIVNVIHTTTNLEIASEFSVSQSMGGTTDGNGYVLCFYIDEHRGIFLPSVDGLYLTESEVAIPGILELKDLLWIVSVENYLPVDLWMNEVNMDIINIRYKPFNESLREIIKTIAQNTINEGNTSKIIDILKGSDITYNKFKYEEMLDSASTICADKFMEKYQKKM